MSGNASEVELDGRQGIFLEMPYFRAAEQLLDSKCSVNEMVNFSLSLQHAFVHCYGFLHLPEKRSWGAILRMAHKVTMVCLVLHGALLQLIHLNLAPT